MALDFMVIFEDNNLFALLEGLWVTVSMTFMALILSTVLGLIIGLGRMSKQRWISLLCSWYLAWFRGTPLLVQLMILYYGLAIGLQVGHVQRGLRIGNRARSDSIDRQRTNGSWPFSRNEPRQNDGESHFAASGAPHASPAVQ
jgi:His/Glu/Gln/Arg/opine family amino acid ABC transporter permease subunit